MRLADLVVEQVIQVHQFTQYGLRLFEALVPASWSPNTFDNHSDGRTNSGALAMVNKNPWSS